MRLAVSRLLLGGVVLAAGLIVAPPLISPAVAAAPELQITADARYDVVPQKSRVHLTLDTTITNTHRDSGGTRSYYDTAILAVLPGTANFRVSSPGATPTVSIREQAPTYTLLTIKLGRRLFAGKHTALQLQFDLVDRGGDPGRAVRIGPSLAAFPVWAFATAETPGGSVSVAFPAGYTINQQAGEMAGPTAGSGETQVYASGPLAAPLTFYAYFVADRPNGYEETQLTATVGGSRVPVTIRAWTDDPEWGVRVGAIVRRGLPALGSAIALPYDGRGLVVQESISRTLGGYAGTFDPRTATIQVGYAASPFVVLHEIAHVWLNGSLASDRWILEAFASWYASEASSALDLDVAPPRLTDELAESAIPLNGWQAVGLADQPIEDYAYAATFELAQAIASRAGPGGLQRVWQAARQDAFAYQPYAAGARAELGAPVPDWRGFLDLLEERTEARYGDLWQRWVVRPTEAHLLDERSGARLAYVSVAAVAGDWELPPSVRRAMSAWQFEQAQSLIAQSRAVLERRPVIAAAAANAGLTVPATLREAFEGEGGPTAAADEADRQIAVIEGVAAAVAASRAAQSLVAEIGLLGLHPEFDLAEARSAFADGDFGAAEAAASAAEAGWRLADQRGRERLLAVLFAVTLVVALLIAAIVVPRTRRARRRELWP